MKTDREIAANILDTKLITFTNKQRQIILQCMEAYADQFKPKWVSDEEINKICGDAWEEANEFYYAQGGVNPTPFNLGFKIAAKLMRDKLLPLPPKPNK